jgi:hypothetical protein
MHLYNEAKSNGVKKLLFNNVEYYPTARGTGMIGDLLPQVPLPAFAATLVTTRVRQVFNLAACVGALFECAFLLFYCADSRT